MRKTVLGMSAVVIMAIVMLAGCASADRKQVTDVAATPLKDLNVIKLEIPTVLRQAEKGTFAAPADAGCEALQSEMLALDTALGRNGNDGDEGDEDDQNLLKRGKDEVEKAAVKALQSTAEDVVPFRKWVRKLTGAERRSKDLADAVAAGYARHSFLKGFALAKGCTDSTVEMAAK